MGHDLPMEKVPFAFSRALCSLTRPVLRTEIIMTRPFLLEDDEVGGGGDWGWRPSSTTRMWVMYDSCSWPWSSTLEKQLSVIRRRSSSKRSARDMVEGVELALVPADGGGRPPGESEGGRPAAPLRVLLRCLGSMAGAWACEGGGGSAGGARHRRRAARSWP